MKTFITTIFLVIIVVSGQRSDASEIVQIDHNQAGVLDGDTLQIGKTVYQLAGIDAPELGQACNHDGHLWLCGLAAGYRLHKQLEMETTQIKCFVQPAPQGLPIAACLIGDEELSSILLKGGNVTALANSPPHYAAAEHLAKQASLGIWSGEFIPPSQWRKGRRLPNEHDFTESTRPAAELPWKHLERKFLHPSKATHAACMVKGDISETNERLYYSPLDQEYESIVITPETGERYFCGDDEARQAGWRRKGEGP